MSGERPVPTGKQTCSSDRNQYLETGELNDEEDSTAQLGQSSGPPAGIERNSGGLGHDDPHISAPRVSGHRGHGERGRNRDRGGDRDWDSQSSKYYGGRGGGYPESDDEPPYTSRPWSRNDYYGREATDYYRRPQRDPYYDDYNRHRPRDDYDYGRTGYPRSQRGWDYMTDPNSSRHGHDSFNMSRGRYGGPSQNQVNSNSREVLEYLEELRITNRAGYRKWYEKYMVYQQNPTKIPFPIPPGYPMPNPSEYPSGSMSMHQSNLRQGYLEGASHISGRSSVNNDELRRSFSSNVSEINSSAYNPEPLSLPNFGFQPIDSSNLELDNESSRSTPQKFISGHALAVLNPLGQLLKISNGGPVVEVSTMKQVMRHLPEFDEIEAFSGPLVKGKTHKNNVIKFCQKKIKEAQSNPAQVDPENFILIWELLILLLKQNGSVVGSDIAELLLKKNSEENLPDDAQSVDSESDSGREAVGRAVNESRSTQRFCDLLLYGHQKDALEYAMVNGLWGHALFLASKVGEKEYGHVLARFANGLSFNHPLQTLYQILSGKQPSSVTCCTDDSFGDWRPHLSMILSNSGYRADLEHKTIVTLGDTLYNGNLVYAAQFCYLMAQVDFSHTSKLGPLLGLSPGKENVIEATQMTEIYEFARSLAEPNATLGITFLQHKFEYTKTLIDFGFVQESFAYCEQISKHLILFKNNHQENVESLKWAILQISERLKRCEEQETFGDPQWMQDIRSSLNGEISMEDSTRKSSISSTAQSISHLSTVENHNQDIPSDIPQYTNDLNVEYNPVDEQQTFTPESKNQKLPPVAYVPKNQFDPRFTQPTSTNEWTNDGYQQQNQHPYESLPEQMQQITISSAPPPMYNPAAPIPNNSNNWSQPQPLSAPLTSAGINSYTPAPLNSGPMGNGPLVYDQVGNSNSTYNPSHTNEQPHYLPKMPDMQQSQQQLQPPAPEPKNKPKSNDGKSDKDKKSTSQGGTGFLGSIFGRFKDKTQMKLPDDKNPSIVWDDVKKQWVNKGGDGEDETPQTGPPPSDMQLRMQMNPNPPSMPMPASNPYQQPSMINTNGQTPFPPNNNNLMGLQPSGTGPQVPGMPQTQGMPNKYSLQKGRSLKNSYVDVLNPNAGPGATVPQMPMMKSEQQQQMLPPPLFTPAPAPISPETSESGQASFLTPAPYGNGVPSQFSNAPSQSYPSY